MTRDARPHIQSAYVEYTWRVYQGLLENPFTALPTLAATPLFVLMAETWGGSNEPSAAIVRRVMSRVEAALWRKFQASGLSYEDMARAFDAWGSA